MPLSDDPWIAQHSSIDPERLHALGLITLSWNHCERMLFYIFCFVFRFTPRFGWMVAHDLGDKAISDRIRTMVKERRKERPLDAEEEALILNALDVYDICRQNRNSLTHFTVTIGPKGAVENDFIFIRTKGPVVFPKELPSKLEDIRRVASETMGFSVYLHKLWKALRDREMGRSTPLPPILVVPELFWKPHPPIDTKPPRPPRPSRASRRKAALDRS